MIKELKAGIEQQPTLILYATDQHADELQVGQTKKLLTEAEILLRVR
jgi:hypothetical protein